MALRLRRRVIRVFVWTTMGSLAVGLLAFAAFAGANHVMGSVGWLVALAVGAGTVNAVDTLRKMKKGLLDALPANFQLIEIERNKMDGINWQALNDLGLLLEQRGFRPLGYFTVSNNVPNTFGCISIYSDPLQTRIVEIQHATRTAPSMHIADDVFDPHVSIGSILGGRITVSITDRRMTAGMYILRTGDSVIASYTNQPLPALLDAHKRLADDMSEQSGKPINSGLTLERYVALIREGVALARARFSAAPAWALIGEYDKFEENPQSSWADLASNLRAVPSRSMDEVDHSTYLNDVPPILRLHDTSLTTNSV